MPDIFLYEKIDSTREVLGSTQEIPSYISSNLSENIILRPYQKNAFENTLLYLEGNLSKNKQTHILYHMATGSGKTVIMAMNILYYYFIGYRNFLFFTNQTNIVSKTKKNFIKNNSSKYLFADEIIINGNKIFIKEVNNFQESNQDYINICFNTVQGIHSGLSTVREGSITIEDFEDDKVVLIADEAHHLNSTTSKDKDENELNATWEDTVNKILCANKDNVLLEYTATCDVKDPCVKAKYLDKIVYNFDLKRFREAGYTKEFSNMQSNNDKFGKTLQAIIMSEYRKLLFEKHNIGIKPVVLLKSKQIKDSNEFYKEFYEKLTGLNSTLLLDIKANNQSNKLFKNAFDFFEEQSISLDNLVNLIRLDFAIENSVNMNELNKENEEIVNSLDEKNNHYRLVFIVDKLTEGWDVLSLFDIVRLYETRQGGVKGSVSKYTISEAQLIGRGARYCPFKFNDDESIDKRKYSDYENPNAICETLLYHCMHDSKYITEIKKALQETGLLPDTEVVQVQYRLKDDFKKSQIWMDGVVFLNDRIEISRNSITSLPVRERTTPITYHCRSNKSIIGNLMQDGVSVDESIASIKLIDLSPVKINMIEPNIVYKAYRCVFSTLSFDKIQKQFPNLHSVKEFLFNPDYVGEMPITFLVAEGTSPTIFDKLEACKKALQYISDYIQKIEVRFKGTKEFKPFYLAEKFSDRVRNITREREDESWGAGVSQNDYLVDERYRFSLFDKDWFAYTDNYGTSEEKKFVKFFSTIVDELKRKFNKVYLIRNEIQIAIYSFENGLKFEPDYVLILQKDNEDEKGLYINMFIEPKGEHLLSKDVWKNSFMLEMKENAIPIVKFVDDKNYVIYGTPLYNESVTKADFITYFKELII